MSTLRLLTRIGSKNAFIGVGVGGGGSIGSGGNQQRLTVATAALNRVCENTSYCTNYSISDQRRGGSTSAASVCYSRQWGVATIPLKAPLLQGFAATAFTSAAPTVRYDFSTKCSPDRAGKSDTKAAAIADTDIFGEASKLGLFAKFKLMYKKYWYVLIPVHVVTSIGWLGGFYYLSKSGVDVPSLLQYIHLSETIIQKVQNSDMGHYAIAYLCYKVATPLRYAVTLGGTTVSIKYLVQTGHIKPMPSKQEIIDMYETNKAHRAAVKAEKQAADKMKSEEK